MGSLVEKTLARCSWRTGWKRLWLADPARRQIADWVDPHLSTDKSGGTTGEQGRMHNLGLQCGEIKPQSL